MCLIKVHLLVKRNFGVIKMHGTTIKKTGIYLEVLSPAMLNSQSAVTVQFNNVLRSNNTAVLLIV
jgi:hypothetical protein